MLWQIAPYSWERKEKFERYYRYGVVAKSTQEAYEQEGFPKLGDEITITMKCTSIHLERANNDSFHARVFYKEVE